MTGISDGGADDRPREPLWRLWWAGDRDLELWWAGDLEREFWWAGERDRDRWDPRPEFLWGDCCRLREPLLED